MQYFKDYCSNTLAGTGNQFFFLTENESEIYTGRLFYRIFQGGCYPYSLLFSNNNESTYAERSVSHNHLICDSWLIVKVTSWFLWVISIRWPSEEKQIKKSCRENFSLLILSNWRLHPAIISVWKSRSAAGWFLIMKKPWFTLSFSAMQNGYHPIICRFALW